MLQAIDTRFQPKRVEDGGQGIQINFMQIDGKTPEVRVLETRVIQVDPQKRLEDGS